MRRSCLGIAGALLAFALAGCSETQDEGPVTYKGTNSPEIEKMRDAMSANMKNKASGTKGAEEKPAPKTEKQSEKKPETTPAPEKSK
jgi:hypothetical protein